MLSWNRSDQPAALGPPPPPPPEVPPSAPPDWMRDGASRARRALPRHPLLSLADPAPAEPTRPRIRGWLGAALPTRIPWGRGDGLGAETAPPYPGPGRTSPRSPVVLLVAGGKAGTGHSTLALDLAWAGAAGPIPRRTLLVDADPGSPDLDLRLGAADQERDLFPSARLGSLLLRLGELAGGTQALENLLWAHPELPIRALLGPSPERALDEVGPEHLDYLLKYVLGPAFDLIVIDAGPLGGIPGLQVRFWAPLARRVLLPLRPGAPEARAVSLSLRALEASCGVGWDRCRGVVGVEPGQSLAHLHTVPGLRGLALWKRPWCRPAALAAEARHAPLAELDRRVAASVKESLTDLLGDPGGGRWSG